MTKKHSSNIVTLLLAAGMLGALGSSGFCADPNTQTSIEPIILPLAPFDYCSYWCWDLAETQCPQYFPNRWEVCVVPVYRGCMVRCNSYIGGW
jgi:hypothetical protein